MHDVTPVPPASDSFGRAIDILLHVSANRLVADASPGPFLDWIARSGPILGRGLFSSDVPDAPNSPNAARLMRVFGHAIYAAMPLPQHRFQPRKLPLPGRNDPCLCGSLRKFKQCCADSLPAMPALAPEMAMPHVLLALGKSAWKTLPAQQVPSHLIEAAAVQFNEQGGMKQTLALLEPWAAHEGRYPDAWAGLLDLLGDTYAELHKPRKRRALAQAMIDRGAPAVQSKGWQRLCLMETDAGRPSQAQQALSNAQRLAPDDPAIALLELSMLLGFGQEEQARERSRFHAQRLQRANTAGRHDDLIAAVREMGERGRGYMADVEMRRDDRLARLDAFFAALPAPRLQIDPKRCSPEQLELVDARALEPALNRWRACMVVETPTLAALGGDGPDVWASFAQWVAVLEEEPALADAFEVLDDVVLALRQIGSHAARAVADRLVGRAMQLWAVLDQRFRDARCEWMDWTNRPALRLLVHHITADDSPDAAHTVDALRRLVMVRNPHDNHGLRTRLAVVLLRRGEHEEALALCERYPDDFDAMKLAHVLALWHLGPRGDATSLLAATVHANPVLAKVMRSRKCPKASGRTFIAFGSVEEAQIAYAEQFELWQAPELRSMLDGVLRTIAR